ncbi:MAG: T9SS type A sorting domain-containing protein [Saprospiraceae bacterium]|nr:T9SS type A sorting domain-containing protein [Saprospiraceae bacterium]
MKRIVRTLTIFSFLCVGLTSAMAQHSVARQWNELLLDAIRNDFARPTIHARNLYHSAILMYDCWAVYDDQADNFFLGKERGGYTIEFDSIPMPDDIRAAQEEAMSYALYRLLKHRFRRSPNGFETEIDLNNLMTELGYDRDMVSTDYSTGSPAALGNYLADQIITFGLTELCNEENDYENLFYEPLNSALAPQLPGNPEMTDPNHWQPLYLRVFIDQSGNVTPFNEPEFLSAEWGTVIPFALQEEDLQVYEKEGNEFWVYHDPGLPPYLDTTAARGWDGLYEWNHTLVSVWSAHLDPSDSVMWDISPASIGNIQAYPETLEEHRDFYDLVEGGDPGIGHTMNPHTGQPYEPQMVPRADYARVLAEFWADGPDSETPPGHWFTILNYVNDHPEFEKRFQGQGEELDDLEWDVKAYFILGGAVHDAAIAAWGIKGWYDYVRPVSAIRFMADRGQSSDPDLPNYAPGGIPLLPDFIEIVEEGDELAGDENEHVGKIKVYAWRGPDYIDQPETDEAGVGWILAENWWPYQRPTFITPPFAGYISGHSTFSRAAAEAMTLLTGDEFFPGGMSEFVAKKNEFLVFEEGPSVDIVLQWATYRDASDQTSLSRIWGGIHPPADDIPGRLIGEVIGVDAFKYALPYFNLDVTDVEESLAIDASSFTIFPNPVARGENLQVEFQHQIKEVILEVQNSLGQVLLQRKLDATFAGQRFELELNGLSPGIYTLQTSGSGVGVAVQQFVVK